jgi:hypothetical protein
VDSVKRVTGRMALLCVVSEVRFCSFYSDSSMDSNTDKNCSVIVKIDKISSDHKKLVGNNSKN